MTFLRFFSILVFLFSWSYLIKIPLANKGSVNLLDLLIIFYLVCFLVWLWREKKIKNFIGWLAGNKLFWLFTVFVFFVFISWTANIKIDPWNNLGLIKSFFVLPGLFAATLPYLNRARANWFRDYLAGFLFYSSGLALASIFAFLAGQTSYDGRVSLIFQSPNQLVFLLSVGYLVSVVFLLLRKENKLLLALSTAVHLLAILSTHSAGAALSVAVLTIGAAAIKKYPQAAIVIPAVAVALQIILLLGILNTNLLLKHSSRNPFENKNSLDSRLVVHSVTERILKNSPLLGIGPANFQKKYLDQQQEFKPYPQWAVPHSHHLFAQIWLSSGFLGLFSFAWLFVFKIKKAAKKKSLAIISLFILSYILLHGLADVPIWKNDVALLFWFFIFL